jgi:hypoxanthine phosphoribosyltransferase
LKISLEIKARGISDYMLVGVSRGGLIPLRLISDHLAAQRISTIGVRFYEDIGKTAAAPEVFFPVQGDVAGRDVILVDDISDTGGSLIAGKEHLRVKGARKIVVSAICVKPHTRLVPDIFVRETAAWVIFPWEVQETIRRIIAGAQSRDSAERELKLAGMRNIEYGKTLNSMFEGETV